MNKQNFPYWMAVGESELVKFSDLSHLIAKAIHPTDAELLAYGAARVNLDDELPLEVKAGRLIVRNAAGLGRHEFPHGDALKRAVLMPHDLTQFLADRGIELRLRPHGSGPFLWTLSNAAAAVAEQEGWHDGTRAAFLDSMMEGAASGALKVRDPRTDLAFLPDVVRNYWELVTVNDLNAWLAGQDVPYRWNVTDLTPYQKWEATCVEADVERAKPEYQAKLARAHELHAELAIWKAMQSQNDPDKFERIEKKKAEIEAELASLNRDYLSNAVPDVELKTKGADLSPAKSAIKWDDHELRRLFNESKEQGWAVKKAAAQRGISRQMIDKALKKAKEKFGPRKADAFSPGTWPRKK